MTRPRKNRTEVATRAVPSAPFLAIGYEGHAIAGHTPAWRAAIVVDATRRYIEPAERPWLPYAEPFEPLETTTAINPIETNAAQLRFGCLVLSQADLDAIRAEGSPDYDALAGCSRPTIQPHPIRGIPHIVWYCSPEERDRVSSTIAEHALKQSARALVERRHQDAIEHAWWLQRSAMTEALTLAAALALRDAGAKRDGDVIEGGLTFKHGPEKVAHWTTLARAQLEAAMTQSSSAEAAVPIGAMRKSRHAAYQRNQQAA